MTQGQWPNVDLIRVCFAGVILTIDVGPAGFLAQLPHLEMLDVLEQVHIRRFVDNPASQIRGNLVGSLKNSLGIRSC